jgi:PASTA domain
MLFAVGVFIGCVAGLVAALALDVSMRLVFARQALPVIVALLALVVASVALVESTHSHGGRTSAAAATVTTTVPALAPSSTAPTTDAATAGGDVRVPNVLRLPEKNAVTILTQAGFQASVDSISLANVPAGYVMSQSPLPDSTAPPGTTVNLQISARA